MKSSGALQQRYLADVAVSDPGRRSGRGRAGRDAVKSRRGHRQGQLEQVPGVRRDADRDVLRAADPRHARAGRAVRRGARPGAGGVPRADRRRGAGALPRDRAHAARSLSRRAGRAGGARADPGGVRGVLLDLRRDGRAVARGRRDLRLGDGQGPLPRGLRAREPGARRGLGAGALLRRPRRRADDRLRRRRGGGARPRHRGRDAGRRRGDAGASPGRGHLLLPDAVRHPSRGAAPLPHRRHGHAVAPPDRDGGVPQPRRDPAEEPAGRTAQPRADPPVQRDPDRGLSQARRAAARDARRVRQAAERADAPGLGGDVRPGDPDHLRADGPAGAAGRRRRASSSTRSPRSSTGPRPSSTSAGPRSPTRSAPPAPTPTPSRSSSTAPSSPGATRRSASGGSAGRT